MTGYTVHTGSSKKFASGWDKIFQGSGQSQTKPAKGQAQSVAKKKKKKSK